MAGKRKSLGKFAKLLSYVILVFITATSQRRRLDELDRSLMYRL